jgi:hypothetical protein
MKKILFTALTAISIFTTAFAKDKKFISDKVQTAFESDFGSATDVNWTSNSQYNQASFVLNGKKTNAFYTFSGEMIGATNEVNFENLSAKAKQKITKKYPGYSIKEVLQFESNEENCYFVSAENDLKKIVFKVKNNMVSVFKQTKKK